MKFMGAVVLVLVAIATATTVSERKPDGWTVGAGLLGSETCQFPILPTNYYMGIAVPKDSESSSSYRYYMATISHLTWASALERCLCMGAELVSVENQYELLYLNRLIAASGVSIQEAFWTSGTDQTRDGHYVWANDGDRFGAADFLPAGEGQPDGGIQENCVSLRKVFPGQPNPVTKDMWIMADESCTDSELLYICREKL